MTDVLFKGAMPAFYDRYLGPIAVAPYAAEMAARVKALAPRRVLETACGTGIVTYAMRDALPANVEIVATDLSQAMVDFAAAKQGDVRISWQQADAQKLPFPDRSFDVVVCQFGVMFFTDKPQGLREAKRVLAPKGRFIFTAWDGLENNELPRISAKAVAELFPDDPPTYTARVPYGYHDQAAITAQLREAGFGEVKIDVVQKKPDVASARDYAIGSCQGGPLRNEIESRDPGGLERATDAAAGALEKRFGLGPFTVTTQALVVTASA
jgi:ubiquinone/menaquinone biosynthesis C-methylase UbiE